MFKSRLHNLQNQLPVHQCDAILIEDPTNLFYLTGLELSAGKLVVTSTQAILFVDGRYLEACKHSSPFPVLPVDQPPFVEQLQGSHFNQIETLGFDTSLTTYKDYLALKKLIEDKTSIKLVPIDSPLQPLRNIKDKHEIQLMRNAAILGSEGFDFVCSILKEGITEVEVSNELEIFWKRKGSKGVAFDPIIAFGPNTSMPHYRPGQVKLKKGEAVLIDIGVNLQHYRSDMTRTVFFGTPDPRILTIYEVVRKAQQAALDLCKPGIALSELDSAARDLIGKAGYKDHFTHNLGHGVGLDIHEYPRISKNSEKIVLEPGMVITIEPGIYLPDVGGVRIEDTVVITAGGHENFSSPPKLPLSISA